MRNIFILIILSSFINFKASSFEPYSGIFCQNFTSNQKKEFFFKHDEDFIYATAYKRVDGQFKKVGNVVGQKISSFILFEDNTIDTNLNFAWHLDMVTKILKPYILTDAISYDIEIPENMDCISKNFWF